MVDLTKVLWFGVYLLAAIWSAFILPLVKSKTTAQQQALLTTLIDTLVHGAEQLYRSEQIQDRLAYVKAELEKRGYTVDIAAIEAAVKRLNDAEPPTVRAC